MRHYAYVPTQYRGYSIHSACAANLTAGDWKLGFRLKVTTRFPEPALVFPSRRPLVSCKFASPNRGNLARDLLISKAIRVRCDFSIYLDRLGREFALM